MKKIRYLLEAVVVKFGLWVFYAMGEKCASNVASKIARFVGKKIAVNKLAYKNLSKAMPYLLESKKEKILDGMWDNLGRIVGEYPHVSHCDYSKIDRFVELSEETKKNLLQIKNSKKGAIVFSGHIGNWEVGPKVFLKYGIPVNVVYRPLNNPYVEKMTASIRGVKMIEKGISGSRKIIEALKKGEVVIILMDQKVSEGVPIKFFHDDAITATSIARIAIKYDVPMIPGRSIRIDQQFRFEVAIEEAVKYKKTGDVEQDIVNLTCKINAKLEEWIAQNPSQWFWVHNRWKK